MMDRSAFQSFSVISRHDLLSRILTLLPERVQLIRVRDMHVVQRLIRTHVGAAQERRLIYVPIGRAESVRQDIASIVDWMAQLALSSWPVWFGDVDFGWYRDDALGNEQLRHRIRELAGRDSRISETWVIAAARQAARGSVPRVSTAQELELHQLSLTISLAGVIFFVPLPPQYGRHAAQVATEVVEWLARHASAAVVSLMPAGWPDEAPVDRLLFDALHLAESDGTARVELGAEPALKEAPDRTQDSDPLAVSTALAVSTIRGFPHPLSNVEKRLWAYLADDEELGAIFSFNQNVLTIRGHSPRVDLLWAEGRLVVELDGFADHGMRDAFERDRHRDYELLLSGYRVLRITNDEINRDLEAAVGKIRDVVRQRRN